MKCPNCGSEVNTDFEHQPISMWGYFGYEILFSIPVVGLICLIIFSFGGTKNINVKNFARSYFCYMIIVFIAIVFLLVSAGGMAALAGFAG